MRKPFEPLPHQSFVLDYLLKSPYRGLLLYHELGSGKSCTSIMYGDKMVEMDETKTIYVFSAAATRQNFLNEYCRICGKDPRILQDNFVFLAYNAGNVLKNLPHSFEDSIVIVDEVHNLLNGKRNGSKTMSGIYDRINETATKVLLLSGTPINKIGDLPLLLSLLKKGIIQLEYDEYDNYNPKKFFYTFTQMELLDVDAGAFGLKFKTQFPVIRPIEEMLGPIFAGTISYVATGGKEFYPKRIDIPFDKTTVIMSDRQKHIFRDKLLNTEQSILTKGRPDEKLRYIDKKAFDEKMALWIVANNRLFTRMVSNLCYPDFVSFMIDGKEVKFYSDWFKFALGELQEGLESQTEGKLAIEIPESSERSPKKIKGSYPPDKIYISGSNPPTGWIDRKVLSENPLSEISPKIFEIFKNVLGHIEGKHAIFSSLKLRSGVNAMAGLIELCNIAYKQQYKKKYGKYPYSGLEVLVYSGDIKNDTERKGILDVFNGKPNLRGERFKIIFLTEAGSTGITLKGVTDVHILGSHVKENIIQQTIGRAIRYKSHDDLPPEERVCRVWRYFALPSKHIGIAQNEVIPWQKNSSRLISQMGIDKMLYYRGRAAMSEIDGFLKIFQKYSIENYSGEIQDDKVQMKDPMTITITFGDRAETRTGMKKHGTLAAEGLTIADLKKAQKTLRGMGIRSELIDLNRSLPKEYKAKADPAAILVIRNAVEKLGGYGLYDLLVGEQLGLNWDKKALNVRTKKVVRLHARYNLVYGEEGQEPDYEKGKGRVVPYDEVPQLSKIRDMLPDIFGDKAIDLQGEGNYYHDISQCGIGFHGDSERKIVIALRLGETIPIYYRWYHEGEPITDAMEFLIDGGDLYAMSAKAVGTDWKSKKGITLRHAAGCPSYVGLEQSEIETAEMDFVLDETPSPE